MTDLQRLQGEVERWMERLFVGVPGAHLRTEDRRKAVEVAALLAEIKRAAARCGQRGGHETKRGLVLVDAAAGKTYVGLLAARLVLVPGADAQGRVIAIEREPARAAVAAQAAHILQQEAGTVPVEVRVGDVQDGRLWPDAPDIVVALHACGPAADVILDGAVASEARHLLLVPCCTGDAIAVMKTAEAAAVRDGIPRHAPVRRRFLQAFVDAERTLRLEAAGYETEVVEFCAPTVTPHNLLWRARRVREPGRQEGARRMHERLLAGQ